MARTLRPSDAYPLRISLKLLGTESYRINVSMVSGEPLAKTLV